MSCVCACWCACLVTQTPGPERTVPSHPEAEYVMLAVVCVLYPLHWLFSPVSVFCSSADLQEKEGAEGANQEPAVVSTCTWYCVAVLITS